MVRSGAFVLGFAVLNACAADAPPSSHPAPGIAVTNLASVTSSALADAVKRTGFTQAEVKILKAEAVTWSDGSLGCPQPGMMYTQALVPGYRVKIDARGQVLDYHAGKSGQPVLCPAERSLEPVPDVASRA